MSGQTREQLQEMFLDIALMDASSPHDGAVFFSGPGAKRRAKKLCDKSDGAMKTVIDTPALKEFVRHQSHYFGRDSKLTLQEGYTVGDWISERFAAEASGTVRVFLDGIKPHGTFNRAEVPALLENEDIDRFLVYDSKPTLRGIEPYEEMEFNRADFETYIERKLVGIPDRRMSEKHTPLSSAGRTAETLTMD
ncbi:MAG: hypothetical protein KDI90_12320 [Alphaproteobacteria bacterium]|nr:hypothetical protein [Alphaproteobacteria bacterium]